jgi:hypothetical protein
LLLLIDILKFLKETMRLSLLFVMTPSLSFAAEAVERDYTDSTWWTVYLTALLCLFTLGLMLYTAKLWRATVKLSNDAEENLQEQRQNVIRSLETAERAARAAEQSVVISEKSLSAAQRAFVFWKGYNSVPHIFDNALKEYVINAEVENVGATPATDVRLTCNVQLQRGAAPQIPTFTGDIGKSVSIVLGPRSVVRSQYIPVSVQDLFECWERRAKIFVWMRLEYRDIFDSNVIHHHEQCAEINLIHDPRTLPPQGHPPYLQFSPIGEQNSSS